MEHISTPPGIRSARRFQWRCEGWNKSERGERLVVWARWEYWTEIGRRRSKRSQILEGVRSKEDAKRRWDGRRAKEHVVSLCRYMSNDKHLIRLTLQNTMVAVYITSFNI
jgi:hypothetical protein